MGSMATNAPIFGSVLQMSTDGQGSLNIQYCELYPSCRNTQDAALMFEISGRNGTNGAPSHVDFRRVRTNANNVTAREVYTGDRRDGVAPGYVIAVLDHHDEVYWDVRYDNDDSWWHGVDTLNFVESKNRNDKNEWLVFGYWISHSENLVHNERDDDDWSWFGLFVDGPDFDGLLDEQLPITGTASYAGPALGAYYRDYAFTRNLGDEDDPHWVVDGSWEVAQALGKVNLVADFGENNISGTIDNITLNSQGYSPTIGMSGAEDVSLGYTVVLNDAPINGVGGNRYDGTFSSGSGVGVGIRGQETDSTKLSWEFVPGTWFGLRAEETDVTAAVETTGTWGGRFSETFLHDPNANPFIGEVADTPRLVGGTAAFESVYTWTDPDGDMVGVEHEQMGWSFVADQEYQNGFND